MKNLNLSASSLKILSILISSPQEQNLHTLAAKAELSVMGISKIIKRLAQQKLVTITLFGKSHLVKLRKSSDNVIILSLTEQYRRAVFIEKHQWLGPVVDFLRENFASPADFSLIFGSYASGEESTASDLDILIVSSSKKEVLKVIKTASVLLKIELSPVIVPAEEFIQKVRQKHRLYREIMEGKRIIISGEYEFWQRAVRF